MMGSFIRLILVVSFRVAFWALITSNFTWSNIFLGLLIAFLIPLGSFRSLKIRSLIPSLQYAIKIVPNMLVETWQIIRIKNPGDNYALIPICNAKRKDYSNFAQFMQVIFITATPMSIVVGQDENNNWRVHTIADKRKSK